MVLCIAYMNYPMSLLKRTNRWLKQRAGNILSEAEKDLAKRGETVFQEGKSCILEKHYEFQGGRYCLLTIEKSKPANDIIYRESKIYDSDGMLTSKYFRQNSGVYPVEASCIHEPPGSWFGKYFRH
jgi:hypothetical protein